MVQNHPQSEEKSQPGKGGKVGFVARNHFANRRLAFRVYRDGGGRLKK